MKQLELVYLKNNRALLSNTGHGTCSQSSFVKRQMLITNIAVPVATSNLQSVEVECSWVE